MPALRPFVLHGRCFLRRAVLRNVHGQITHIARRTRGIANGACFATARDCIGRKGIRMRRRLWIIAWAVPLIGLTGCHVPTRKPPSVDFRTRAPLAGISENAAGWPDQEWWKSFGDAQLDTLMDLAQKQSPVLDVLDARVRLAAGQVEAARANAGPDLTGAPAASRSHI